ncbi:MAG: GAF domain-containing protein, partial [Methylophilaceae bacterium]|nr:GAF domain-containing protein [Methylophilaceae bacterium]
ETARIEDANPFLVDLLGYSYEEIVGKKIWNTDAFKDTVLTKEVFAELQTEGFIRYDDVPLIMKDGTYSYVEFISNLYNCDGVQVIQCNIRDNNKRHFTEIALKASTRALEIISDSNAALVRSKTENILLNEFCRIAVETGHYCMACVAIDEDGDQKNIKYLAYAGPDQEYSKLFKNYADKLRHTPTWSALHSNQIEYVSNIDAEPTMKTWRDEALKNGYKSVIALPFMLPNEKVACFTLYSPKVGIWSSPERKLLEEITADLAFGVSALQTAIDKFKYQASLQESLEKTIQVIVNTAGERDSYTAGHQKRVAHLCTRLAIELGLSAEKVHGLH